MEVKSIYEKTVGKEHLEFFKTLHGLGLFYAKQEQPDRETKDFMVTFYRHWLEDEMTIPDAFRKTQQEMKERFYNPYQWAGFVLVE